LQFHQERVDIVDASGVGVQNQDAILRGLKQPPITQFGGAKRLFRVRPGVPFFPA
jgi:hypothetical protein